MQAIIVAIILIPETARLEMQTEHGRVGDLARKPPMAPRLRQHKTRQELNVHALHIVLPPLENAEPHHVAVVRMGVHTLEQ